MTNEDLASEEFIITNKFSQFAGLGIMGFFEDLA